MINEPEYIATDVVVESDQVHLELNDGSTFSFPWRYFERLEDATPEDRRAVRLRVGGRALRWDALDEDIWIADVILQRCFPAH